MPRRAPGRRKRQQVRDDLIAADADLIYSSFNCTVARWLTHFTLTRLASHRLAPPEVGPT